MPYPEHAGAACSEERRVGALICFLTGSGIVDGHRGERDGVQDQNITSQSQSHTHAHAHAHAHTKTDERSAVTKKTFGHILIIIVRATIRPKVLLRVSIRRLGPICLLLGYGLLQPWIQNFASTDFSPSARNSVDLKF